MLPGMRQRKLKTSNANRKVKWKRRIRTKMPQISKSYSDLMGKIKKRTLNLSRSAAMLIRSQRSRRRCLKWRKIRKEKSFRLSTAPKSASFTKMLERVWTRSNPSRTTLSKWSKAIWVWTRTSRRVWLKTRSWLWRLNQPKSKQRK